MKLRSKLVLIMGLCFALFSLALAVALGGALGTKSRFETFLNDDQALLQAGTTMYAQGLQMGQALRNIVLDPENKAAYKNLEEASKEFKAANDAASALASADPPTRNMISEVAAIRERQKPLQQKIISLAKTEQAAAIAMIVKDETPLWREMRSLLTEFAKAKNAAVAETRTGMVANAQRMIVLSVILGVMAVLAGVILMTWLVRNVMQQLGGEPSYAAAVAGKIAKGDLTAEIELEPNDRSSLLFGIKGMRDSLLHIVSQVRAGVDSMATAASQIAAGNQDLSSRTEEQASSLQETASSMEQLTTTVQQNADSARQANVLATSASAVAQRGGEVVTQVVDTMNSICASSKKIEDIIAVIDGIAFQTNILALNAAVEAARAGDQGRGFAVVASEVRSLAQRSANAAKEIKLLITDSVEKVDAGVRLVDSAGTTMSEIVDSIARVNNIMSEITEASQAQTIGIEQINQAINQLDSVTQQNAALVEEAAAAAESQQIQAGNLTHVVSVFHLDSQSVPTADAESERGFKMAARPAGPGAHPRTRALPRSAGLKRISNSGAQSRA